MEAERLSRRVKGVDNAYMCCPKSLHSLRIRSLLGLMILFTQKKNGVHDGQAAIYERHS